MSRDNTYKLLVTLWKHSQDSVSIGSGDNYNDNSNDSRNVTKQ